MTPPHSPPSIWKKLNGPQRPTLLLAIGALAVTFLALSLWWIASMGFWEDDAYIHLEFARSLAAGHGFLFNGHLVYGDTSPLWVWLLVAFHSVFHDWLSGGKVLTMLAALFALVGAFFYARSLVHDALKPAETWLFAALMLLAFVLAPYFGYWAFSGMEALSAAGLVCWICVLLAPHPLADGHIHWRSFLVACALAGLGPLLRPEMAFFTLLLTVVLFRRLREMRFSLTLRVDVLVAGLVLLVTPSVLWGRYALHAFGSILPTTNAAKRAAPSDSVLSRLLHIYAFGYPVTVLACLLLAAWVVWYLVRGRRSGIAWPDLPATGWLVVVWTAVNCLFYLGNHTFVQTRYIFVNAPVLTIAVFALALRRWPNLYRSLLTVMLLYGAAVSLLCTLPLVRNKVVIDAAFADLAATMRTLPPNAPVALYAIGEAAFLSQHPVVDTGGITRPGVIPYMFDSGSGRTTAWAISEGAQYEVIDHSPVDGAQLVWSRDIPITGWYFNPRRYRATERLQLWKLPVSSQSSPQHFDLP